MKKLILLLAIMVSMSFLPSKSFGESYFYYREYFQGFHWSKEKLRASAPEYSVWLKKEYGLENRWAMPYGFEFDFDLIIKCSICSFSDPPETFTYDVKLSRVQFGWLKIGLGHGREHFFSIRDVGTYAGYGTYRTYIEVGILFNE